ncbi:GTPase domain-containing protein [Mycolicibacterium tusciae]|uniref:GTPase domain-containing protein n=1 Tax=Mycolicibacterium tusciae TaxID=75922 RepID=UPI00024A1F26|nr:GTPase domain-containing protein [Mycolicibacterium tusciae]
MMQINAAQQWLHNLPGESESRYTRAWEEFALNSRPVATLFGSYDTGKSSLLRRLLIDSGRSVPDWLTISARHETFESNTAEIGDCLVRDTPGFAVDANDVRGQSNSSRALNAVGLTDLAIAVVTPQLVTSDRDLFKTLIDRNWPASTLWFVISRFDEAGADPEYNLAGYEDLSARKVAELRDLFDLNPDVPVFVVAQDPFQEVGPNNDVSAAVWDKYRSWDGMDALRDQIMRVTTASLTDYRAAAAGRYWTSAVVETLATLRDELAKCQENARVAAHGLARRDAWESELRAIDQAAKVSLDGLVASVVDQWLGRPDTPLVHLQSEIEGSLSQWFTQHDSHLQRLQRSISKAVERDHRQPSWNGFAALVAELHSGTPTDNPAPAAGKTAEHVEEVGIHVLKIMKALAQEEGAAKRTAASAGKAAASGRTAAAGGNAATAGKTAGSAGASNIGRYISAAEAALPLAVLVAKLIDDQKATDIGQTHGQQNPRKRQSVIDSCTNQARSTWEPFVEHTRALIEEETGDQVRVEAELGEAVRQLQAAIAGGESLLGG